MRYIKSFLVILLPLFFLIGISTSSFAKIIPLTIEEQYDKSTNVVRAVMRESHPIKITEYVEYSLWEFEVTEEFKGKISGIGSQEKQNRVTVIFQTKHDWDCPSAPLLKEGNEYILFLQRTNSDYLYSMVADVQGETEVTEDLLKKIRELKQ